MVRYNKNHATDVVTTSKSPNYLLLHGTREGLLILHNFHDEAGLTKQTCQTKNILYLVGVYRQQ